MTRTATHMVGAPQLALVYAVAFIAGYLFCIPVTFLFLQLFAFTPPGKLVAVLVLFAAGYYVGQFWYSKERVRPASSRAWRAAVLCAVVPITITAVLLWGVFYIFGETDELFSALTSGSDALWLASLPSIYSLLSLLIIRLGIGVGIKLAAR